MRIITPFLLILIFSFNVHCKQNSKAESPEEPQVSLTALKPEFASFLDGKVAETSGLIFFDNIFWTINDSGNPNILYRIDPKSGAVVSEVFIENSKNIDWEELTQDQTYIYIADIGDNSLKRDEKQIYRIKKTDVINAKNGGSVNSEVILFSYPNVDGKAVHYDAEALVSFNGLLHIFTKDFFETHHFTLTPQPGKSTVTFVEKFKTNGQVTGAAINPENNTLVMVGYLGFGQRLFWEFKGFDKNSFFKASKRFFSLGALEEAGQMEAVCFSSEKTIFISNENFGNLKQQLWNLPYPIK